MKFTKTSWMVLGIGIIVIAAASLYMVYQGEEQKRQDAKDSLANAQAAVPVRITERNDLESQLSQLEDELVQWQNELSQLETELAQVELTLNQTGARFPISAESIEYDEVLFSFARDANLRITSLTASEPTELTLEGITYATTFFTVAINGEVADILYFINTIVADDDFQTAILEPITINVPDPLTEMEKEEIKGGVAAAEIDRLITQAMEGLPEQESLTQEAIDKIVEELGALIEELKELTASEIEELTASEIEELITQAMEGLPEQESLTQEDIDKIVMALEEALEELKGLTVEEIAELAAKEIEEAEMPSATINLMLYTYQGEGE